jgi:hypothetical protein
MQGAEGYAAPHGPCIMHFVTVSYANGWDDAHLNVLEEVIPKVKESKKKEGIKNIKIMIMKIQQSWLKLFRE